MNRLHLANNNFSSCSNSNHLIRSKIYFRISVRNKRGETKRTFNLPITETGFLYWFKKKTFNSHVSVPNISIVFRANNFNYLFISLVNLSCYNLTMMNIINYLYQSLRCHIPQRKNPFFVAWQTVLAILCEKNCCYFIFIKSRIIQRLFKLDIIKFSS